MKLVIHIQFKENYGAHDWDGKGECPQYWKFKGGSTYVVESLTDEHVAKINEHGFPNITRAIESFNDYFQEYVCHSSIVEDDESDWPEWETPIQLYYGDEGWYAIRITPNSEYSHMRSEVIEQRETWLPVDGERVNYKNDLRLADGWHSYADACEILSKAA